MNNRISLNELRNDIVQSWFPKRQESVEAVEKAQEEIRSSSTGTDNIKLYSSAFKLFGSVVSLNMKTVSLAGAKGADFWGDLASMVSLGSDLVTEAANFTQAEAFQKIMEKTQQVIDREMDEYKVVSDKMIYLSPRRGTKVRSSPYDVKLATVSPYDVKLATVKLAMGTCLEGSRYLPSTHHTLQQVARESEASQVGWALGNGLPLLAAAWGIYKGAVDILEASADSKHEERFLATKLKELKDDANTVVNRFNALACARGGVCLIPIPFPPIQHCL